MNKTDEPCAQPVDETTVAAQADLVPPATSAPTAPTLSAEGATKRPSRATKPPTQPNDESGSTTTANGSAISSPISKNSAVPSVGSTPHWRTPTSIKGLASQANRVATLVLNNGIDVDIARAYSGLIRTVAQAASIEVTRSRFLQTMPDLSLEQEVDDGGR